MDATVLVVAYATPRLDTNWIPSSAPVVVIHNDDVLDPATVGHPTTTHLTGGGNVGFGAAINRAVDLVETERLVLCNPDVVMAPHHWYALDGGPDEVVTIPLVDPQGVPTRVCAPYWTPMALAATTLRLGDRLAPRGSRRREAASRTLGWARTQRFDHDPEPAEPSHGHGRSWPLAERWISGAVLSVDTERFRSVGGFDQDYFLYFEDTDLCRRLADAYPTMTARVASVTAGVHTVGASAGAARSRPVEAIRRRSAIHHGAGNSGLTWLPFRLLNGLLDRHPSPTNAKAL